MHLLLQDIDLLPKLFYQLQLLHNIQRLSNNPPDFLKRRLEQPINQEGNVLNGQYFDRMIAMLVLADGAEYLERVRAVSVHAYVGIVGDLRGDLLELVVLLAD